MEETVSKKYLKGFNDAYLLAEHKPKLVEQLLKTTTENEYLQGMRDGKRTFEQEKTQSRYQELDDLRSQNDREQDLER